MADLLIDAGYVVILAVLTPFAVYIVLRVGTLAVLRSYEDFHRTSHKRALSNGE